MELVLESVIVWAAVLLAVLAVAAAARGRLLARVLWVDTIALVLIVLLTTIAYARSDPAYLDAAIVLALLAFAGTLAAVRFHDEGHL